MDLKNLESTSVYAIEAAYKYFWDLIPDKYKIEGDENTFDDIEPFYDPTLTFDNRLQYKLVQIPFPNRDKPWFVLTWNTENGIIHSTLNRRRYPTAFIDHEKYGPLKFRFIDTDLHLIIAFCCNSMAALYELQENMMLRVREKLPIYTRPHSLIGKFPISLNIMDTIMNKLDRNKGTLCYLTMTIKVNYPLVGDVQSAAEGVIKEIHAQTSSTIDIDTRINSDIEDYQNGIEDNSITLG